MLWTELVRRNIPFAHLETLQSQLIDEVMRDPAKGYLLVSEPRPTFTYGRNAKPSDLLWAGPDRPESVAVSRGGKWTYHGTGQILVYPIVHLPSLGYSSKGVRNFLQDLRSFVVTFLTRYNVPSIPADEPFGIFVEGRKIVSFGIHVRRGVVSHGLALYGSDQSRYFEGIHPCGVPGQPITSLEQQGVRLSWEDAARELVEQIKKGFNSSKKSVASTHPFP